MKTIATLTLGLAIAGASATAFAQAPQPAAGKPARHAKIDANGDGVIDRAEAAANPRMAQHFETLDANKDGRITADERPQRGMREGKGGRGGAGGRMAQLDTDKDGRFSRQELASRTRALENFSAIDTNGDGFLTREEMAAHHKANPGERGARYQQN